MENNNNLNSSITNSPSIKINSTNFNTIQYNNKHKNKLVILVVILSVFLILITALYCYGIFMNSGTTLTKNIINTISDNIDESLDYFYKYDVITTTDNISKIDGNIKFETNIESINNVNDYNINYTYINDSKNKNSALNLALNKDNTELIDAVANFTEDGTYISLKELYSKIIYIENTINTPKLNINISDLKYGNASLKTILKNAFNEEMFTVSLEKAKIDNELVSSRKIEFDLNKDTYIKINDYISSEILKDGKLTNILVNIAKISNDNYSLDDLKNDLLKYKDVKTEDMTNTKVVAYTNILGNKILKIDVTDDNYNLSYQSYKYKSYININDALLIDCITNNNFKEVNINYDKKDMATLKIKNLSTNNIDLDYEVTTDDDNKFNGSILLEKKDNDIKFNFTVEKDKIKINTDINFKDNNNTIKFNYKDNDDYFKINSTNNFSTVQDIELLEKENIIDISDITDKDIDTIKNNLKTKLGNDLYEDVNNYIEF